MKRKTAAQTKQVCEKTMRLLKWKKGGGAAAGKKKAPSVPQKTAEEAAPGKAVRAGAKRLMRRCGGLWRIFCAAGALLLLMQPAEGALKCYNWYFTKNDTHQQPRLDSEFWFIQNYEGYYVDQTASEEDKVLYLTFDAGYENGNVEKIVDTLNAHGVPGAFFILSHLTHSNAALVQKMAQSGHMICNHTAHHKDLTKCTDEESFAVELNTLAADCEAIGVQCEKYFRPPEGKFCEKNLQWAHQLGYTTVFWSFAYCDWDNAKQPDPESACKNILEHTHPGAVILLHPTSATNAQILDTLLTQWKEQGYRFGTLRELTERAHAQREKEAQEPQSNYRQRKKAQT